VSNKRATASTEDEGEGCGGELEVAVDDRRARVVLLVTREVCCIQKSVRALSTVLSDCQSDNTVRLLDAGEAEAGGRNTEVSQ
jgi:hypothetical protein